MLQLYNIQTMGRVQRNGLFIIFLVFRYTLINWKVDTAMRAMCVHDRRKVSIIGFQVWSNFKGTL